MPPSLATYLYANYGDEEAAPRSSCWSLPRTHDQHAPLITTSKRCLCKQGSACSFVAMQEASLFRAEALRAKRIQKSSSEAFGWGGSRRIMKRSRRWQDDSGYWDCGTRLYDSFELNSFSNQLGRSLAAQAKASHESAAPRQRKLIRMSSCLPALSIPRNIISTPSSCFHFRSPKLGGRNAFPRPILSRNMITIRKAFRKLAKAASAAKVCFTLPCDCEHLLPAARDSSNDSAGHHHQLKHKYRHHHYHFHVHHHAGMSNINDEEGAVAKLLQHFKAEAASLSPQTLAALRKEIDMHHLIG